MRKSDALRNIVYFRFQNAFGKIFFYERVVGKLSRQDKNMGAVMDQ